jgi:8-oxo-dGTP diphosphatase
MAKSSQKSASQKSSRNPVLAAGGIVVRKGAKPLVAIVQRSRDDAWVLPKGKLKPNERPIAAARREAREETGSDVRVHEFLGVISYRNSSGPKLAHFWRMEAIGGTGGKLMDDIKAVKWLPLPDAIDRLSLNREHAFLRSVGHKALKRTRKKARIKLRAQKPAEDFAEVEAEPTPAVAVAALQHLDAAPAVDDTAPQPIEVMEPAAAAPHDVAATPRIKSAKSQRRWHALARLTKARLTKRWQSAIGRPRRAG